MAAVAAEQVLLERRVVRQVMAGRVQKVLLTEPPLFDLVEAVGLGKQVLQLMPQ